MSVEQVKNFLSRLYGAAGQLGAPSPSPTDKEAETPVTNPPRGLESVSDLSQQVKLRCGAVTPEAHCEFPRGLVKIDGGGGGENALVSAVHAAWRHNLTLVLTPDVVLLAIVQGFANHVSFSSADSQREEAITVRQDAFEKGSSRNPWSQIFDLLSDEIKSQTGERIHSLLSPRFTTTGSSPFPSTSCTYVTMDTTSTGEVPTESSCGVGGVLLEGTIEDWTQLRNKALSLPNQDLQWWLNILEPILDEFVATVSGTVNAAFWHLMYSDAGQEADKSLRGWIVALFPYITSQDGIVRNPELRQTPTWGKISLAQLGESNPGRVQSGGYCCQRDSLPLGVSRTYFLWQHLSEESKMILFTGFMGVSQDKQSLTLRPEIGWAVAEDCN